MGWGNRPGLRTALVAVGLAVGMGFIFTYFFGFLIGITAFILVGLVFAVSRIRTRNTVKTMLYVFGLTIALLLLTFVFGLYGGIAYIILILVVYYLRRKKSRPKRSGAPLP